MNMTVDAAGGSDQPFASNRFSAGTDDDADPWLHVRIARLADAADPPVLDADVGLDDALSLIHI